MKKSNFSLGQKKKGGEFLNEREIYEYLKKVNLMDLLDLIIRNSNYENRCENVEVYYTSNDLYRLYSAAPIIVVLKCPMWNGFAIFGEE